MDYIISILIFTCIFAILGLSWNLIAGYSKIFALCQSAFCGTGAYCTAILMTNLKWEFIPSLILGMCLAAVIALLIALPSLRVHSDYFVVTSIAFLYVFYHTANNIEITGAAEGIKGIPIPQILGWQINSPYAHLGLCVALTIIVYLVLRQLTNSTFGKTLLAVGSDELASSAIGKNITATKVTVVLISAALAAIAGSLYAVYVRYINANDFFLDKTFMIVAIVLLGGFKSMNGSVLGAIIIVMIPELMRFTALPTTVIGPLTGLFYGLVLVVFILFRPQGLLGKK